MFTTIEKYQKAFLVFITVLLTAAFGLGGVCFTIFDPSNFTSIATIEELGKSYSDSQFQVARDHWRALHRLARKMSPQARASSRSINRQDYREYIGFMQQMLMGNMETSPMWDQIYMLSEEVQQLDARIDSQLGQGKSAKTSQQLTYDKATAYMELSEEDRQKVQKPLTDKDIWKCLILVEEAVNYGIQVSNQEIDSVIINIMDRFGNQEAFSRELQNMKMLYSDFRSTIRKALMVVKLIDTKANTIKIRTKEIYENIKNDHQEYKIDYVIVNSKSTRAENEREYRNERVKFFEKQTPNFFQIDPSASFEYVYAHEEDLLQGVEINEKDIEEYAKQNLEKYQDDESDELEDVLRSARDRVVGDYKKQLAKQKAQRSISELRITISTLKGKVPLATIAKSYNFTYGQHTNIEANAFLDLKDVGTTSAKKQVYESLKPGDFSRVFAGRTGGYFFLRLTELIPSSTLTKEDVENNETAFLRAYYRKNKWSFNNVKEYRLAYVVANDEDIEKTLIPTTNNLKQFYDKYKEELYKTDSGYQKFEDVKEDVLARAKNLLKTRILQQIHAVQKQCKDLGESANIGPAVEELGRRVGLKYYESSKLQSVKEIEEQNVPGGDSFTGNVNENTKVSEVINYEKGKYFFIVLEHKAKNGDKFEDVRDDVKEKFLTEQADEQAKKLAEELSKEFKTILDKVKQTIDKHYDTKMAQDENNTALEAEKSEKLKQLPAEVFRALALSHSLTHHSSAPFRNVADIKNLTDFNSLSDEIKKTEVGSLGSPVNGKQQVCLFLLTTKRDPNLDEIPQTQLVGIERGLWELKFREKFRSEFANYNYLVEKFQFAIDNSSKQVDEDEARRLLEEESAEDEEPKEQK